MSDGPQAEEKERRTASIVVVMPAYNAARTLAATEASIPRDLVSKVILVDDHSLDETVPLAEELGVEVIAHPHNVGYGGNQKTCYMAALREGADIIVMLHPDGQYDPGLLSAMVEPILHGQAEMTLGSRFLQPGGAAAGGMPRYKIVANRFLTAIENHTLGTHFSELHTGYRAYSRRFLETVPFLRNSNDFVFDTQIIAQSIAFDLAVKEVAVSTRYFPDASSASLRQSVVYGFKTLAVMLRYHLHTTARLKAAIFLP